MADVETGLPQELREQQRAVGRVLRAMAEGGGLQPVLDEVVAAATRLCAGEFAELHLAEGDVFMAFSYYVAEDADTAITQGALEQWELGRRVPHARDRSTLVGRVALAEDVVTMPDMLADPEYQHPLPAGTRAGLGVPIILDGELIGTLGIVRDVHSPFTDDDVELVRTFADQAAIAIRTARLVDSLQRQLDQQQAIGEVLRAIARSEGLQTVLDEIVETVTILCRGDNVRMWLVKDGLLHAVANGGWSDGWEYDKTHPHPVEDGSASGRAALTREVVHIPDVTADPGYTYDGPVTWRTNLSVPILLDDEVIGVFGIVHKDVQPFDDDVIALVKTFADQAAIAIANARLLDATQQQLEQQRAVADVLGVVAGGEGLEAVFDSVVTAAAHLCAAEYGQLCVVDGDVLRLAGTYGASPDVVEYERAHPMPRDRSSVVGRVAVTGGVVHIPDTLADPEYTWPGQALSGYRAMLGVPIYVEGELMGVINVVRDQPAPFTPEHIELVETFADQAAIAITKGRLLAATQRQLDQQQAISNVLAAVARQEGLESVLHALVESACRLCEAQFGEVYLVEGELLRLAVGHGGPPELYEYERDHPQPVAGDRRSVNGRVLLSRNVEHIPDILEDEDYSWSAANDAGIRSLLGAPLLAEGELVGVFNIVRTAPLPFGDEAVELLKTFADQAAIAITNARLIDAVRRQLDQQRAVGEVFGVVARAEGLDRVFDAAIDAATRLCDGGYGGLYLLEDGVFNARAYFGDAEQFEYELEHPHPIDRKTLVGRCGLTRDTVHIPDLGADADYDWPLLLGHSAGLAVPIVIEDEFIGAISVTRTPEPFTDEQIGLVKTFADQVAIAIANARLIDAVEAQLEQQQAIADVLRAVARSEGLEAVFETAVKAATRLSGGDWGGVYLADGDLFRLAVLVGGTEEHNEYERSHPHGGDRRTLVGRVAESRSVVHIPDALADPEYSWPPQKMSGFRAMLGAPVLVEDELIAVIGVVRTEPTPFSDEHVELVKTFADQAAIAIANARLLDAVERQRAELSRFVSPQVAELVSSDEGERMLAGHRAYVSSMFFDLRGFTSFTELAEPEELFEVLREYHVALGELIPRYEGTLEHFAGDGLLVFFNDPVPVQDHERKAVELALAAQARFEELAVAWRKRGHELGLGIGIAAGYATLGRIGFEGRYDYGVLGTVNNLASRLSSAAEPGQTLISQRVYAAVEEEVDAELVGELELKGFGRPVPAYEVRGLIGP